MTTTGSPLQGRGGPVALPPTAFTYVHSDVPADMRLNEWRIARDRARHAAESAARRARRAALVASMRRCIGAT